MDQLEEEFPSVSPKTANRETVVSTGLENGPNQSLGRFVVGKTESKESPEVQSQEQEIKDKIIQFIKSQQLDVDMGVIEERLQKATLVLEKPNDHNDNGKYYGGIYHPPTREAFIVTEKSPSGKGQYFLTVHELLHAASGQVFVEKYNEGYKRRLWGYNTTGLAKGREMNLVGIWLNEAVTEALTEEMTGIDSAAYIREREALLRIIELSDIRLKVFLEAYFEELDLRAEPGKRMPRWHTLQERLNATFGPRFLQRLDQYYDDLSDTPFGPNDEGIKAIDEMYNQWQELVQRHGESKARKIILEQEREAAAKRKAELAEFDW